jgi:hypothetical protein
MRKKQEAGFANYAMNPPRLPKVRGRPASIRHSAEVAPQLEFPWNAASEQ